MIRMVLVCCNVFEHGDFVLLPMIGESGTGKTNREAAVGKGLAAALVVPVRSYVTRSNLHLTRTVQLSHYGSSLC